MIEAVLDVTEHFFTGQLFRSRACPNIESLSVTVFEIDGKGRLFAMDNHYPSILVVIKVCVQCYPGLFSHAAVNYVDQMQIHLVFVWEAVGLDAERRSLIGYAYEQFTPIGIEKPG